jgi:uncharacterized membrane protein YdjX (TVP38/TMEM64 family)
MPAPTDTSGTPAPPRDTGSPWKPILVFTFLAAALGLIYFSPLGEQLKHVRELADRLRGMGGAGVLVFCAGVFVLTAVGVPRLALCALAGAVYGFWQGLLLAQLPTLAGYYSTFLFVRWGGREYVLRHWPKIRHMHAALDTHAAWKIFLLRQAPVTGILFNFFFAVSQVRHRDFLLGTFAALFPQAVPVTLLGSSAAHANSTNQLFILAATVLLFAGYILFRRFARQTERLTEE